MFETGFETLRFVLLALVGIELLLSALLIRPHLGRGRSDMVELTCTGAGDCHAVVLSRYGLLPVLPPQPVPVAALGFAYYTFLAIWLATVGPLRGPSHHAWAVPALVGLMGLGASAWFIHVMARRLHAWCMLCLGTHLGNFLLVPGLWILWLAGSGNNLAATTSWKTPLLALALGTMAGLAEIYYIQTRRAVRMLDKTTDKLNKLQTEQFLAAGPAQIPLAANDFVLGQPDAPHTAVIFSDFSCSSCAEMHSVTNLLHARLGHNLRIVHKGFPLNRQCNASRRGSPAQDHESACQAAAAAEAVLRLAGPAAFQRFSDLLYEHQHLLARDPYEAFARQVGLNVDAFNCLREECEVLQKVQMDAALGASLGVHATPAVFLDGRPLPNFLIRRGPHILPEQTLDHWRHLLDQLDRIRHRRTRA